MSLRSTIRLELNHPLSREHLRGNVRPLNREMA